MEYVLWLDQLNRDSVPVVGGKGANLGEMMRAGLPVPPGLVITVHAHQEFLKQTGLGAEIERRLVDLNPDDSEALAATARELQGLVEQAAIPDDLALAVEKAYEALIDRDDTGDEFVAVRSSATSEDAAATSFAGMFTSYLNVRGRDAVLRSVRSCWASLFGARALFYREKQQVLDAQQIAVVVQKMVNADKAGVAFTVNPATGDTGQIVIEAAWGLGEAVVAGEVTPDRYLIDKASGEIVECVIAKKTFMLARSPEGENLRHHLDEAKANARVLSDEEIRQLVELVTRDEAHYGSPQDTEWAIVGDRLYFVQTRPVTTIGREAPQPSSPVGSARENGRGEVLVRGLGASPRVACGRVRVLQSPQEGGRLQEGEVLVTEMTTPDWVPLMRRAAAIVTNSGGMTSHAAIVSRELGVACIVGTGNATEVLSDGQVVTVDGQQGVVLQGEVAPPREEMAAGASVAAAPVVMAAPITGTRLYVNLAEPSRAEEVAQLPVDGVGLLRAEFMILSALDCKHPRQLLQEGRSGEFVDRMAADLQRFAAAFAPRPVVYRSIDFKTNEFRGLAGGEEFEPVESNPMIGYRGCFRNIHEPDLFGLELQAIRRVREGFDNLHLMIPFVRTRWEFAECKRLVDGSGLTRSKGFQLWVMAEVPSIVYWLPEYAALGATGVSIGSNDLTQLLLGVDRDSEIVASIYDERDPAVLDAIHRIIQAAHAHGMTASICGQAPSVYADYAAQLVRWGIDSISVTPDVVDQTRRNIAVAEQRLLLEGVRQGLLAAVRQSGQPEPGASPATGMTASHHPAATFRNGLAGW